MKYFKLFSFLIILLFGFSTLNAQFYKIIGKVIDKRTSGPLTGVVIVLTNLNDTIIRYYSTSDAEGSFSINRVNTQSFRLKTYFIGYKKFETVVTVNNWVEDVGQIQLIQNNEMIKEVIVTGSSPATVQKGDTSEMDANAFKTTKDASAEDLVKKMPTVSVDNSGSIKAQGETVQKVLVDGKPFFGDDPTVALRNLPAEVIDKVQIYNELSDQARLTGFDDGNTTKTMNIVTKKNNRNGIFGKFYAGYGTEEKYQAGENVNFFNGDKRISVISMKNNINQQNFSPQDLLGISGGPGGRGGQGGGSGGGGNFMVGQQSGISITNSIGLNYSDNWGEKIKVTSSYFFNNSKNDLKQQTYQQYFNGDDINSNDTSESENFNHRFNLRLEYTIDTMNSIVWVPRLSFQTNNSNDTTYKADVWAGKTYSRTNTKATGYNFSNNLTYRHKFIKKGRTISLSLNASDNSKDPKTHLFSDSLNHISSSVINYTNQQKDYLSKGYSASTNIMYTEPIGKSSLLQVNYINSISHSEADLFTYNNLKLNNSIDTSLSNKYTSDYITNSAGLGYRLQAANFNGSFTINYQDAELTSESDFPFKPNIIRSYKNWMPMAFIRFKFSDKNNFSIIYRTSTTAPSISQLQNVIDNSNTPDLSRGDSSLKQQVSHSFISRISFANPEKSTNFFAFVNGTYTTDYIGNSIFTYPKDTTIPPGIVLKKNARLSMPANFHYYLQLNTFMNYGFPLHFIKSNLNFNAGISYSKIPGEMNNQLYYSNTLGISPGVVLSSNVSENIDFSVLYFGGYNFVKSTISQNNNDYYSHSIGLKFTWIFWHGIVWSNDATNQFYKGFSSSSNNIDYILWNMGLGKKLFSNQRGELKLNVYDLLNQNASISKSNTANYYQEVRTNPLKRYFMLTFTYNLRQFKNQENKDDQRKFDHPPFERPPGGGRPFDGPPGPPHGGEF